MRIQTAFEEKWNAISHGIGALFGVVALILLIVKNTNKTDWSLFSAIIYGISIIVLFTASTCYHAVKGEKRKHYFRILDHISIYFLIAGTYTPFTIIILEGQLGWMLFIATWIFALTGIILKLFFTGRFNKLSTIMYVLMGWQIVFAINPLIDNFSTKGLQWLFAGGIFYTIGAILYSIKKIPFNHAIFHVFVLLGTLSHFVSIYFYF